VEGTIREGDFVRCDVGIKYLRLNSDHQQCTGGLFSVIAPIRGDYARSLTRLFRSPRIEIVAEGLDQVHDAVWCLHKEITPLTDDD